MPPVGGQTDSESERPRACGVGAHRCSIILTHPVGRIPTERAIKLMTPSIAPLASGFVTPHPDSTARRAEVLTTEARNGNSLSAGGGIDLPRLVAAAKSPALASITLAATLGRSDNTSWKGPRRGKPIQREEVYGRKHLLRFYSHGPEILLGLRAPLVR